MLPTSAPAGASPTVRSTWAIFAILFSIGLEAAAQAQDYTFTHLSGNLGGRGFEDGSFNAARFNQPQGVAVDGGGNVYIADTVNHTIRRVSFGGVVSTLAGLAGSQGSSDGTGSVARFSSPRGVAVDGAGTVYVADTGNHTIRKVTSGGVVTTIAGLAGTIGSTDEVVGSAARFNQPAGVAVDAGGNVYVADLANHTIRKVAAAGAVSTLAGLALSSGSSDGSGSTARFKTPASVAVDGAGNLYVADYGNHTIRKVTSGGTVTTLAGLAGSAGSSEGTGNAARFLFPAGVAVDGAGNLYVADQNNQTLRKVTSAGSVTTLAGLALASGSADGSGLSARFRDPAGVAVDAVGNLYVADQNNHTVRKVTSGGIVTTLAGMSSSFGTGSPRFYDPRGIASDSAGNVYVADTNNNTIRKVTTDGVVSTIAGLTGVSGSVNGSGSAARFNGPVGVTVDANGNLYVAESGNHTIRKITTDGVVTTFAGLAGSAGNLDGTGSAARFNGPYDVALDGSGNLYVADNSNSTIRKITPAGVVTTLAGLAGSAGAVDATGSAARFNQPVGIAVDTAGDIYVTDQLNHTIRKVTSAGVVTTFAGLAGSAGSTDGTGSAARFNNPDGVAVDAAGNLYISDTVNHSIRKITSGGVVSTLAGLSGTPSIADGSGSAARFFTPHGVAVDAAGNVYVADYGNKLVRKVTSGGVVTTHPQPAADAATIDGGVIPARFYSPTKTAVDGAGNVYVADHNNHTIRKVTSAGVVSTLAGLAGSIGSSDGSGSAARFNYPAGVAVDGSGNVYVSDTENHAIRKVTGSGVVTTFAGLAGSSGSSDGSGDGARFNRPAGVAVDAAGNVYVADYANNTIRKITSGGVVSTLAGLAGSGFGSSDGTGSAARFFQPSSVAVDTSGNVYVTDTNNQTIRRITSAGVVTTLAGMVGVTGSSDGSGSAARFNFPSGIGVDSSGDAYVGDTANNMIRKVTSAGVVTTLAGTDVRRGSTDGTGSAAFFNYPEGVAVDGAGNVYVADKSNHTIRKVTAAGVVTTFAGRANDLGSNDAGITSPARFHVPTGVAVDGSGNVYVADSFNDAIRKVTGSGVVTTLAGRADATGSADTGSGSLGPLFSLPNGVAVDGAGNVYVADFSNHTIRKVTAAGVVSTLAGFVLNPGNLDGTGNGARFRNPGGVAVDSSANVYVADSENHTIRKITSGGVVTTLAGQAGLLGGSDGTGNAARFRNPGGVAVDGAGNVFVADTENHTIRKVTSGGVVTTFAGVALSIGNADGAGTAARFSRPTGVAVDTAGNVYVADSGNHVVRKITSAGVVSTLSGLAGSPGNSAGTALTSRFSSPRSVAVDSAGNVYVADSENHAIRIGRPALADVATIDASSGAVGAIRQLGSAPSSATAWEWTLIRRPSGSTAQLSSSTGANPTFTPDRTGLFRFRLRATGVSQTSITSVDLGAVPAPVITTFAPTSGFPGAAVTITGSNLTGASAVRFNGTAATSFTVDHDGQITANVPAGSTSGLLSVTTTGGTSSSGSTFTVLIPAPVISSFSPTSGIPGTAVTILGSNFANTSLVEVGGTAASFSIVSSTQLTMTVPSGSTAGTIRVTTPGGVATSGAVFTVGPTVSTVSPNAGPLGGGQSVTITGSNLGSSTVDFGGSAATVSSNSATSMTVVTPPRSAGSVSVSVTNAGGTATSAAAYTYLAAPAISLISPSSGPLAGGQSVTITGANLASATVTFSGTAATVTSNTSTSVTVTTPARSAGPADVSVTTAGGSVTATSAYTYAASPTITSVSPSAGPVSGGQSVVIGGANLSSASVTLGGAPATVSSNSSTSITVSTPLHAAGVVDVSVVTPGGTVSSSGSYTFVAAPAVSAVSPSAGPLGGGQSVTITGTNLSSASVDFGGAAAVVTSSTSTSITVSTPAHAAGLIDVTVTTAGGTAIRTSAYTFTASPVISTIVPSTGPLGGGQTVTLSGSNLSSATAVDFGGASATVTSNSATSITVTTPARSAGAVNVSVSTAGGTATNSAAYTYIAAPTVSAVSPSVGPLSGGQSVTITGTNLTAASVSFGGSAGTVTSNTATSITVTTPARVAGVVDVSVTTPGGTATTTAAYTFTAAPIVSAVSPSTGPLGGGQSVTITGTNLSSASVDFGGAAAVVTSNTATSITVTTPAHAAGLIDVTVTTPGGTVIRTSAYTFTAGPVISTVAPSTGPLGGGQTVTLSGSNLSSATAVDFGGTSATVTSNSATSITVTTPARSAGAVNVSVSTAGGTATNSAAYTYIAAPAVSAVSPSVGPLSGGQSVTITGTNLTAASVSFGGTAATVTSNTSTSITVTTPARVAGVADVSVTTAGGTATATAGYTFTAAPIVSAVSPSAGPLGGGQSVTITGTNLSSASVDFGGAAAAVTSNTSTSITVSTPAHAAGLIDVTVTTPGGTVIRSSAYTFTSGPVVSTVTPNSGPLSGGQSVTITGSNLASATVDFGGAVATVTASSSTSLTVSTPAHAAGVVDVTVSTAGGTTTRAAAYTFVAAPVISTVSPSTGPFSGGQSVTITGTNLGSASVDFGGAVAAVSSNSPTSITVSTPVHAVGIVDVSVTTSGGTAVKSGAYTYLSSPAITSVSPSVGPIAGGQTVTIIGTNLGSSTVDFGGTAAVVTSNSATSITVTTPPRAAGLVDVSVTNAGGTVSRTSAYNYAAVPTLTAVSPSSGPLAGGQSVTITGTNLSSATNVDFGGVAASVTSNSSTSITVVTPPRAAGSVDVSVTTAGGTAVRSASYTFSSAPTISAVSPSSGPTSGGTSITITGAGFQSGATVVIGGVAATSVQVVNGTTVTATTAARSAGAADVVVTNSDGQSATLAGGFTFVVTPVIIGFSPTAGPPGTLVSIFGSSFAQVSLVELNGSSASFTLVSDSELTALVPAGATTGRIKLTSPGTSVTSLGTFTVSPSISTVIPAAGPLGGGQSVTITGTNLAGAVVEFGGTSATVTSNTSTSLTVSTPAHPAGVVEVSVRTLGGTARRLSAYTFTAGPTITSVSPALGGVGGGRVITISGSGFLSGTGVSFGGAASAQVVLVDSATLSVTTPAHPAGVVDVVVTSAAQTATATGAFTYVAPGAAPTISSVAPAAGPTSGGTAITISGTNFSSDAAVTIGGEPAREVRVSGSTSIMAVTPPHVAGAVAVVITNGDGQSVTSANGFTYGCSVVSTPSLAAPANNTVDTSTSPVLTFSTIAGAFRYDVLVDTVDPPLRVVAKDLSADTSAATISFTPSNLAFGTKYFWRVVAKGDPACLPVSTASSPVQSFTTTQACGAPPSFTLTTPAANAAGLAPTVTLTWTVAPGASRYEVFLGTGSSFSSLGSTSSTNFNATGLAPGTTYSWNVVALASCNETLATGTPRQSFTIGGDCAAAGSFALTTPASSETNVLPAPELKWAAAASASSYDVFLDTANPPRLFRAGVARTSISPAGLLAGRTYFWKVVANVACDLTKSSSTSIASFTVRGGCTAPGKPEIKFAPATVAAGQTYVLAWSEVPDLDADGSYVVERSLSSTFSPLLDSQLTGSSFASFTSASEGTVHHRVRAIPSCGGSGAGANSDAKSVTVATGRPNVVFTVNPSAVVTNIGDSINDKKTRFTIDNISNAPVQVILSRSEINSSPFFTVTDPTDPGAFLITLQPRKPKTFEIHFTGPTNTQAGSYQGLVLLNVTNSEFLPYAFVNLKVGGQGSAKPEFRIGTAPAEFLSLPAFSGEDAVRPATEVDIFNPGNTPMELAAEIGPEQWLVPESGWNAAPIQPNSSVKVRLVTRRERAPAGSPLPRYTYFTVRTRTGESARLLVQDRETSGSGNGRGSSLDPGVRSYIVPRVVSMTSAAGRSVTTRLRLSNVSGEAVQAELFFTPKGIGGFDASAVRRASILLPGNNVVAFTDPLVQLFGLTPPASGSLEVRAAAGKIGLIDVSSSIATNLDGKGQRDGKMPAVIRGEGARVGSPHIVGGVRAGTGFKASLALVETTGMDRASVKVTLIDKNGVKQGEQVVELLAYELDEIPELLTSVGGGATSIDAGRLVLTVESGAGAVVGVVTLTDDATDGTAALVGQPVPSLSAAKRASHNLHAASMSPLSWVTPSALTEQRVVPLAVHGPLLGSTTHIYRTSLSLTAPLDGVAGFTLRYLAGSATPVDRTVNLAAAQSLEYVDVLEELFGIAATAQSQGQILISTDRGQVYATLWSARVGTTAWTLIGSVPVVTPQSEALTGAGGTMQRPLLIDGIEQSVDTSRGTRWSMLLNEISGQAATVVVRLYEAGNRSAVIAEKSFAVGALSQTRLETLFAAMDLDSDLRQKDRTNVLAIVTATGGTGMVAATAVVVDNLTGDAEAILLAPRGGVPATGVGRVSAVRTVEVAAPLFRRADVNGDGTIAVADIFYMINNLFTNGPAPIGSGDANSDGTFSVADIFYLINFLFTNGPAPAS